MAEREWTEFSPEIRESVVANLDVDAGDGICGCFEQGPGGRCMDSLPCEERSQAFRAAARALRRMVAQ